MQATSIHFQPSILTCPQNAKKSSISYKASSWSQNFIESLKSDYTEDIYGERQKKLKEEVKKMIEEKDVKAVALLELIDNIQRLGIGYHFKNNIKRALDRIVSFEQSDEGEDKSLHGTALRFRLLRQHGFDVSQDVFNQFKDHNGNFNACLSNDVKGLLSLHEATYLAFEGETLLDEAKAFALLNLKHHVGRINDSNLADQVSHSLDLPLQRRMVRLEAREYIDAYNKKDDTNHVLLELAMVDFNMVQSKHQRELQDLTRWWRDLGLQNKFKSIRDRIMESFFCSVGCVFEPQFSNCRKRLAQVMILVSSIDDIYDIYGSMEELEQFTKGVEWWSMDAMEKLPECLKLCLQSVIRVVNEISYVNFKEHGVDTRSHLKKAWADLCKSFLLEAKWHHTKFTPSFKDYMDNAWISSSGVVLLLHTYCLISPNITQEALDCFDQHNDLFYHPSLIFRLCNDLVPSMINLEGDETAKSIPCYMHETGHSEKLAQEHMKNLIEETWKKMNRCQVENTLFPQSFMNVILNLIKTVHCVYQYGDAYGSPNKASARRVLKVLIEPISLHTNI